MNGENGGIVKVTLKDVYDEVRAMRVAISALADVPSDLQDHEGRLRSVERWKSAIPPTLILAVVSIAVSIAFAVQ